MEDANVPMEQQVWLLESIANDSAKLIPLLADNGSEMNRLTGQFHDMDVALSETDIKVLKEMETAFANARKEADSLSSTIWVKLSGAMTALAEGSAEFFQTVQAQRRKRAGVLASISDRKHWRSRSAPVNN